MRINEFIVAVIIIANIFPALMTSTGICPNVKKDGDDRLCEKHFDRKVRITRRATLMWRRYTTDSKLLATINLLFLNSKNLIQLFPRTLLASSGLAP
ncbi:MAG: hypothetical protein QXR13_01190 [Candidatus Bathyarchaeia archaeon]